MSILNSIFGAPATPATPVPAQAPVVPAVAPDPTNQGQIPAVPAVVADPANPVAPLATEPTNKPNSPLDQYKELWDTLPTDPNAATSNPPALDVKKLQELVGQASFTQAITPETLAAVTAGGDGAADAFTQALNAVAQQVMVQSTLAGNKLLEQQMTSMQSNQASVIAEAIRKQTVSNNLQEANPVFSSPAVSPVIEAVQSQLAAKNPNASPAELTAMAQNFVATMVESLAPAPAPTPNKVGTQDWNSFLAPNS